MPVRMPAESDPHERTIMCWPARDSLWRSQRHQAELDYAAVARAIARFEPVTMIARPDRAETAADLCGPVIEVIELPIDDSWARDSGPVFVVNGNHRRSALDFTFNSWGDKFLPYADDAKLVERLARVRGDDRIAVPMVLEGGSIAVDGAGTLITTEQCLLNPNRNPTMTRVEIERVLCDSLGATVVVWMPHGLALDEGTDGHVDNVAAFAPDGVVLLQGCDDPREDDHVRLAINRRCVDGHLDANGEPLTAVVVPVLPFVEVEGERCAVPYLNFYVCNGAVIVPVSGHAADDEMLALIGTHFTEREVVSVPGSTIAFGGGGPHCITQQVPALA